MDSGIPGSLRVWSRQCDINTSEWSRVGWKVPINGRSPLSVHYGHKRLTPACSCMFHVNVLSTDIATSSGDDYIEVHNTIISELTVQNCSCSVFTQYNMHHYLLNKSGHTTFSFLLLLQFIKFSRPLSCPQLAAISHTHQDPLSRGGSVSRLNWLWGRRDGIQVHKYPLP